jgi:hypothetical protein
MFHSVLIYSLVTLMNSTNYEAHCIILTCLLSILVPIILLSFVLFPNSDGIIIIIIINYMV